MMTAPFPYHGGKSRVASLVWERFGEVDTYVEPFAGSLAVLLGASRIPKCEVVNDLDGYITNVWRAIKYAPAEVARICDEPINELDLRARRGALQRAERGLIEELATNPGYFNVELAAWWIWGKAAWTGGAWPRCSRNCRPAIKKAGRGIHALGRRHVIEELFESLSARLRHVRVLHGGWERCLTPHVGWIEQGGVTGVFLDPPYTRESGRGVGEALYATDDFVVGHEVARWARERGEDPRWRIAVCGLKGEHDMPGWEVVPWVSSSGGENSTRERIWFSPRCTVHEQQRLF